VSSIIYSLVVPVFNEEETLLNFYTRVTGVLEKMGEGYEIIFVNDGSKDKSIEILNQMHKKDPRVKIIDFSRNFGQQMAISSGLNEAAGDSVIIMDADLQDPPELIPQMAEKWREGYDVVYAVRKNRKEGPVKRFCYAFFYRLMKKISYLDIPLDSGDFSLMDRGVVDCIKALPERNRFLRGLRSWVGFKQTGVKYDRDPRAAGETKYSLSRLFKLAFDGFISFSFIPLKLATMSGFFISFMAFIGIGVTIFLRLQHKVPLTGWASMLSVILFLGGIQLISVGIIGEYIGRIFDEVKQRPPYIVKHKTGFNGKK
jgi:polyisoprenyl-phosphate glycosyltransferase